MKKFFAGLCFTLFLAIPGMVQSQWEVGPHLIISIPRSDFANVSDAGGGFGIKGLYEVAGPFRLRGDFAFLSHGREFRPVQGFVFPAEIRNESYRLIAGPQFSTDGRKLRVFAGAQAGFYFFRTNINITDNFTFAIQDSRTDAGLGWNIGGGIQYDIGLGPWLDIAFEYQTIYNLDTEFEDDEGNTFKESFTANEYTINIGVIFFLGR